MFTKANLEIYNIDVEDIITTSTGEEEVKGTDPNLPEGGDADITL